MSEEILRITTDLACKDLAIEFRRDPVSEQELTLFLADHIAYMLEHQPEQLFSALYLIDIDENAVRKILTQPDNLEEPANYSIAQLIVTRLRRKAETRIAYRSKNTETGDW